MERNKKASRIMNNLYCDKCGGSLVKDARDYYICMRCGMTGSLEEIKDKAHAYDLRFVNDIYNRYGKSNAKRPMPWWLVNTYREMGVDLKRCLLEH
jgi:ribosomal protein S27AE